MTHRLGRGLDCPIVPRAGAVRKGDVGQVFNLPEGTGRLETCPTGGTMASRDEVEERTRRYGREIFGRIDRPGPVPFGPAWWDERLMEWSMGDESLKLQLFRFVDVLPVLHTPAAVARHLREYVGAGDSRLPGWVTFL